MATDPKALKEQAETLNGYHGLKMYFDLAKGLAKLRHTDVHTLYGCKTFWEFTDKAEIGGQRTARYLIDTFEKLDALGYTELEIQELFATFGWTKLMHIAKHRDKRVAINTLKKDYGDLTTAQSVSKLKGKRTVTFTAEISKAQRDKLIGYLEKKYGIEKGKGHGKVGKPFGQMIDAICKKA